MLDAARAGDLQVLQWLCIEFTLPVSHAFVEAQRGAQWGIAKWILVNCEVEDPSIDMAAVAGDGDMQFLQWAYSNGFGRPTAHALETAAFNGHLDTLEWLVDGPAKLELTSSVLSEAVRGGHLEVLKWLCARECPRRLQLWTLLLRTDSSRSFSCSTRTDGKAALLELWIEQRAMATWRL